MSNILKGLYIAEDAEQKKSVQDILSYLKKIMGVEPHEDYRNHLVNNNEYFVLKNVPVNSLKIDLPGLDKSNVEKYKQMDFSKAPPIVIGSDGYILDGYHRANVAKALNIPMLKAYVGVGKQDTTENIVTIGLDKPQGNFAGDTPVNIGTTITKKPIKIGQLVKVNLPNLKGVGRVENIRGEEASVWIDRYARSFYLPLKDLREYPGSIVREQGVAEVSLEEVDRRGFLKGLGAAALGAAGMKAQAQTDQEQDLGDGFVLVTIPFRGHTLKAVLDKQTNTYYTTNRRADGTGAIIRSMAPYIMVRGDQASAVMNVGPATLSAIKKAGLDSVKENVDQGVVEGDPGARYKVKQIGHDAGGDYYISPSTGKKVYKPGVKRGDHENPNTGEIKSTSGSKSFKIAESSMAGEFEFETEIIDPEFDPTQHTDPHIPAIVTYDIDTSDPPGFTIAVQTVSDINGKDLTNMLDNKTMNRLEDRAEIDYRKRIERISRNDVDESFIRPYGRPNPYSATDENKPRIRKYTYERPDGSIATRYEVLDSEGRRVSGQGSEGFDDLDNAKELLKRISESQIYSGGNKEAGVHWYKPRHVPNQDELENLEEDLRKWFKEKWVRFGPDGKIRGACARGDDSEGKPKCLPQAKAHALGKKGRKYAASKKRREDPNPERRGPAKNVATKKKTNEEQIDELKCWPGYTRVQGVPAGAPGSCKKKTSEDQAPMFTPEEKCPECGGPMFSELLINEKKDACYYKVKSRYKVWPSAYASGALVQCRKKGAKNWGTKSEGMVMGASSDASSAGTKVQGEAANPAQQAAIAIAMKKAGKKPKKESAIMKGIQFEGNDEEFHTGGSLGTPYPSTYEQETLPYRTKGQKRTQAIAFEDEQIDEKWSEKYKKSIDCSHPKGFSQRAHCQGRKKK